VNVIEVMNGDCSSTGACVSEEAVVSSECGDCFGELVCCTAAGGCNCSGGFDSNDCMLCQLENGCADSFNACSGIPLNPPMSEGACTNPADMVLLPQAFDAADGCAVSGGVSPDGTCDPLAACVSQEIGLSLECSMCFADMFCCSATACPMCGENPDGEDCGQCVLNSPCMADFEACSGMEPGPPSGPE